MNELEMSAGLPATPGYRYAKLCGQQLHVAGQVPHDSSGKIVGADDPYQQALRCLENLTTLLACHDFSREIQRFTVYVVGPRSNLTAAWQAVLERFNNDVPPATLLGVTVLGHEAQLVEVDAVVARNGA